MTDLRVLDGKDVNKDALRERLDFLADCIRGASDNVRELLVCDYNAHGLHGVILGLVPRAYVHNCKTPDEFMAYLNRQAKKLFGKEFSELFFVYHDGKATPDLYDRMHAEEVVRQYPEAFQFVSAWSGGRLNYAAFFNLRSAQDEALALLSGYSLYSARKYYGTTEYSGYFPPKDFLQALYGLEMDKPENQALEKELTDYEENGFRQMVRDPKAFEKRRKDLENRMKAAFEPVVASIDGILNDREKTENYVVESHEVDRVQSELLGQPTHARYLFEKIFVSGKLDWVKPPNCLVGFDYQYRLDSEGNAHLARIDDALQEVGYFKRLDALKKEYCKSD